MGFGTVRGSVQGGFPSRNAAAANDGSRRSQTSLFTNTLQPGNDEHIQTEMDLNEFSVFQKDAGFGASIAPSRKLMGDPS